MSDEPPQVRKRALDVTPLEHGIWCSIEGGAPFVNTIVLRRWSEDGARVVFMLDSHNFYFAAPDEEIEVVERVEPLYSGELLADCLRRDAEQMKVRPVPKPTVPDLVAQLTTLTADRDSWRAKAIAAETDNAELMDARTFWMEARERAETACIEKTAQAIAAWVETSPYRMHADELLAEAFDGLAADIRGGLWRKDPNGPVDDAVSPGAPHRGAREHVDDVDGGVKE